MKHNLWLNLLMACGLLLILVSSAGAQAAASTTDVPSALSASRGTAASASPSTLRRGSGQAALPSTEYILTKEGFRAGRAGLSTSSAIPDMARRPSSNSPQWGENGLTSLPVGGIEGGLDLKQALDDFVADPLATNVDQPVGADEIVSFLTDQAKPALQAGSLGPAAVFNPAETNMHIAAARLTDSKFVVAYRDVGNSDYGTAIVGQVFGTSINWGNEYVFNAAATRYESVTALSDSKFVVAYQDGGNSNHGTAIVGQVSGTTISYGSKYVFNSTDTNYESVAALSDTKFVVAYTDWGNSGYGTAIVGQVSGTSINWGNEYVFNAAATLSEFVVALSGIKFVVAYQDVGNSNHGTAIVGQVSGTAISYGSEYVFNAAATDYESVAALSDSKFVVAYGDAGNSWYGTAIVGQVSGTTISYGSEYVFNPAVTQLFHSGGVTRLSASTFVVGFENQGDSDGRVMVGTVSGNTISFGNQVSFNVGSNSFDVTVVGLSSSKYVVAWCDQSNGDYGTAKVGTLPTLGSAAVFNPAATYYHIATAKLTDSKFVVAYTDVGNSYYGTAIVGQVSGTSITWGSEYVFNATVTLYESVAALSAGKFVVAYQDVGNSDYGTAIVGTVSGTAITWGNEYVFNSTDTTHTSVAALSAGKFVVAYRDWGNFVYGTAIVGQVSGTSISYGSEYVFNAADTAFESVAALSAAKFVVAYTDLGNAYHGTAIVGTVSGTSISYGPEYVFNMATTYDGSIAALSASKFVVAYQDGGNAGYGTAIVGTVTDTSISYGAEYVFNSVVTKLFHSGGVAGLSDTAFVVGYENDSDDDGRVIVGTVSGNTITFGHQVSYNAGSDSFDVTVVGLSPKFVVAWDDESNGDYGTAKIGMISANGEGVYLPLILRN